MYQGTTVPEFMVYTGIQRDLKFSIRIPCLEHFECVVCAVQFYSGKPLVVKFSIELAHRV